MKKTLKITIILLIAILSISLASCKLDKYFNTDTDTSLIDDDSSNKTDGDDDTSGDDEDEGSIDEPSGLISDLEDIVNPIIVDDLEEETTEEEISESNSLITIDKTKESIPYKIIYNTETYDYDIYYQDDTLLDSYLDYSSTNMYDSFLELSNGENLRIAYLNILAKSLVITLYDEYDDLTRTISGEVYHIAFTLSFSSYKISKSEGEAIWNAIKSDNPIVYWIDTSYLISSDQIYFLIGDDYVSYEKRCEVLENIVSGINEIGGNVNSLSTIKKIRYIYKYIMNGTDYAYDSNNNASAELIAHNVDGFFSGNNIVCEGYAKTLQIICNYLDINNCYVIGVAGTTDNNGGHAWNYIEYNDEWYFLDVTWEDSTNSLTKKYYYMLSSGEVNSLNSIHDPYDQTIGIKYQYKLPELSNTKLTIK